MLIAVRAVSLAAVAGVTLFHALGGRLWSVGLGVLLLASLSWVFRRWLARAAGGRGHALGPVPPLAPTAAGSAATLSGWPVGPVLAVVSGAVAGAFLALQLVASIVQLVGGVSLGRVAGLLPHPNVAAPTVLATWTLLIVATRGGREQGRGASLVVVLGTVTAAFLLLAAGTRSLLLGAILGVVISSLVGLLSPGRKRNGWLLPAVVVGGLGVALLVAAFLRPDLTSVFASFDRGPIHMTALQISAISPWVGLGDGAWTTWAGTIEPSLPAEDATHSHSAYLFLLLGGGATGLSALLLLLGGAIWGLVRGGQGALGARGPASFPVLVAISALAVQGLVDVAVLYPTVYAPLILVACTEQARRVGLARGDERV